MYDNLIDIILSDFKNDLDIHFKKYRNHVLRIYNYSMLLDDDETNYKKYVIAATFHDLGIWHANTFDYLKPSIELARAYLIKNDKNDWIVEITLMIDMHHKRSFYKGEYEKTVEVFRKADWIDVTLGIKKYGLNKSKIKAIQKEFPNKGFHWFLVKQTFRNLLKNPTNPLPMFKK